MNTAAQEMSNQRGMQFKMQYFLTTEISKGMKMLAVVFMMPEIGLLRGLVALFLSSSSSNQSDYRRKALGFLVVCFLSFCGAGFGRRTKLSLQI